MTRVKMELTPEGLQHPITKLAPSAEDTRRIWQEMPPLRGFNQARSGGISCQMRWVSLALGANFVMGCCKPSGVSSILTRVCT